MISRVNSGSGVGSLVNEQCFGKIYETLIVAFESGEFNNGRIVVCSVGVYFFYLVEEFVILTEQEPVKQTVKRSERCPEFNVERLLVVFGCRFLGVCRAIGGFVARLYKLAGEIILVERVRSLVV